MPGECAMTARSSLDTETSTGTGGSNHRMTEARILLLDCDPHGVFSCTVREMLAASASKAITVHEQLIGVSSPEGCNGEISATIARFSPHLIVLAVATPFLQTAHR